MLYYILYGLVLFCKGDFHLVICLRVIFKAEFWAVRETFGWVDPYLYGTCLMPQVLKGEVNKHLFQNTALNADAGGMVYGHPVQNKWLWQMQLYSLRHPVAYEPWQYHVWRLQTIYV